MSNKLVSDILGGDGNKFSFSIEIVPPKHGGKVSDILNRLESIIKFNPKWINVTKHATEKNKLNNFSINKSPDNVGLCALIEERFKVLTIPHILCNGYTKEETEDYLIDINFLGLNNVLALQGDSLRKGNVADCNIYASDLVKQIELMNNGNYLDNTISSVKTNFHIGVAFYPEKHRASNSLEEDIKNFILKQNAGAKFALGQMCFDNNQLYNWKRIAKNMGVKIPVAMGLKILTKSSQLNTIEDKFQIHIPQAFKEQMANSNNELRTGIDFTIAQIKDLMANGQYHQHFYLMNNFDPVLDVIKEFV